MRSIVTAFIARKTEYGSIYALKALLLTSSFKVKDHGHQDGLVLAYVVRGDE
jgi:hypothetical protein